MTDIDLTWLDDLLVGVDPCIKLLLERDFEHGLEDRVGIELVIEAGEGDLEEHLKWNQYGLLPARARDALRDLADKHVLSPLVDSAFGVDTFNLPAPPEGTPYIYLSPDVSGALAVTFTEPLRVLLERGWVVEADGRLALPTPLYLYALKQRAMWGC